MSKAEMFGRRKMREAASAAPSETEAAEKAAAEIPAATEPHCDFCSLQHYDDGTVKHASDCPMLEGFNPEKHAVHADGKPKKDAAGNFMPLDGDYVHVAPGDPVDTQAPAPAAPLAAGHRVVPFSESHPYGHETMTHEVGKAPEYHPKQKE